MKTLGSEIFVNFFSPMLDMLVDIVGIGVGERRVAATSIEVPVRKGGDVAAAAPVGGLMSGGGGTAAPIVVVVVEFLPIGVDLHM